MRVLKRDNVYEDVSFDKVIARIKNLCEMKPRLLNIDPTEIAQKVCAHIYDGVNTSMLDELAAEMCTQKSVLHVDYGLLASRIIISNNQKLTSPSFSETISILYNNQDLLKLHTPLVSKNTYDFVLEYKNKLNDSIDYSRDYDYDYFGFKTLEKAYLFKVNGKVVERIQHLFMRVAIGLHSDNIKKCIETYDLMSSKYFTHATPTLFHSGTPNPQLLSCFLLGIEDSVQGIYKAISDCAVISKWAGGIGVHIHDIRSENAEIRSTNGRSNGIIPMLRVFNDVGRHINQCFTPDTWVYGEFGPTQMLDCEVGDNIYTIDGTLKPILSVSIKNVNKQILEIEGRYSFINTRVTREHQIYTIANNNLAISELVKRLDNGVIEPIYKSASRLEVDDYIGYPITCSNNMNTIDTIDVDNLTDTDIYMYGFISSQSIMDNNGEFSLLTTDHMYDSIIKYLNNRNINTKVHINNLDRSYVIKWDYNESFPYTYDDFYNNNNKYINDAIFNLPKNKIAFFLEGLVSNYECDTFTFYSKNVEYLLQIRFLFWKFGIPSSGSYHKAAEEDDTWDHSYYYIDVDRDICLKHLLGDTTLPINSNTFIWEGILWCPIDNIYNVDYEGPVYDFNMKDNHNYLTDLGIVHNSGKRNGSFAMYLEPHHPDIINFLDAKKNHGDENTRARDLFYAVWLSDLFMNRVKTNQNWSLMCPDRCKGLSSVYGDEYKQLYEKYESNPSNIIRSLPASDIWKEILKSQMETGTPYICYKDAANIKSNQKNYGIIKSSNLCTEIMEYSDNKEYACCTLASISLPAFIEEFDMLSIQSVMVYSKTNCKFCKYAKNYLDSFGVKYEEVLLDNSEERGTFIQSLNNCAEDGCSIQDVRFKSVPQILINGVHIGGFEDMYKFFKPTYNFKKLAEVTKIVTTNLNKIIDINYYPIPETKLSNKRHRPIGVGVQGLADVYARFKYAFDSVEAAQLNREIFAIIYYASCEQSLQLAIEHREIINKSLLLSGEDRSQFNSENHIFEEELRLDKCVGAYSTFVGSPMYNGQFQFDLWGKQPLTRAGDIELDWGSLREKIKLNGVRNSLLLAPMPTASTSQILGNNECIEPYTSNIYSRGTLAGQFLIVNKYLLDDLIRMKIWTTDLKDTIILNNGSIQKIDSIPLVVRNTYKIAWDLSMKQLIDQAADRGIYVCQSQSLNLWVEEPDINKLSSMHFYAWGKGLKTGIYYLRRRAVSKAQSFSIDASKEKECLMCSA